MSSTATLTAAPAARTASYPGVSRAGLFLILSGLAFVVLALALPDVLAAFYRLVAAPGTVTTMDASTRLGAGLFGALTFGWGVTLYQLAHGASLVRGMTAGMLAWFVVDSSASILLGYGWNTLSNAGFVVVLSLLLRSGRR